MNNCPSCGAKLSDYLINRINNPNCEESCPVEIERRTLKKKLMARGNQKEIDGLPSNA